MILRIGYPEVEMHPLSILLRHPRPAVAAAVGTSALIALVVYQMRRERPTADELETARRTHIAEIGRIIDGTLLDAYPSLAEPNIVIYSYRVAGVTYECSQDVIPFASRIRALEPEAALFELPIQVRYDRANPSDSIVISETWNGLWSMAHEPDAQHAGKTYSGGGEHIPPRKPSR
jgi:hypothetical protein